MCNLYSVTRSQEAMRRLFAAARDLTGNLPPLPYVYPDQLAPIVSICGCAGCRSCCAWMETPDDETDEALEPGEIQAMELVIAALSEEKLTVKQLVALIRLALAEFADPKPDPDVRSETI